ncbi:MULTISPECIES: phosphocarrier protein HPr [Pontibacillus]|uniref:Phosphocarrier protein HPr n=1 Tax=Pontibacillus marinus BH030004 = DSM 16465 TaxID=1385511 RepID=A0A0A5FQV3_9BACI|nr:MULTISPECIES: phosphocarrier protein HPr [Pontibacillus]KGX83156.1 phosphocarrier protein HPr [Pontibacillus marinus BH030004 = DSM 16465]QHE51135.1 phosphocarrier protein HPr [Pontibacillus sp. HMF3514]
MAQQTVKITANDGVHARPATVLVQEAGKYKADINLEYNGKDVNLKSIMGIMSLGIPSGAEVTFKAEGSDEDEALEAIINVVKDQGLGE